MSEDIAIGEILVREEDEDVLYTDHCTETVQQELTRNRQALLDGMAGFVNECPKDARPYLRAPQRENLAYVLMMSGEVHAVLGPRDKPWRRCLIKLSEPLAEFLPAKLFDDSDLLYGVFNVDGDCEGCSILHRVGFVSEVKPFREEYIQYLQELQRDL